MNMKPLNFLIVLILGFGAAHVYAKDDESSPPLGCRDVGYKFEMRILNLLPSAAGTRNSLYFVYNMLDKPVNLYHMRKNDGTGSYYLNHTIKGGQWAALSTCEKELRYVCTVNDGKSSYGKIVDCADSVKICEYANVAFGLNNRGNHWLVDSNSKSGAVRQVVYYGIIPR
ncbi:endopeptidase IV [Legionella londiniensis]|uniref:Enhanced entry protein EnhB n=2 Tax=Legionella londiniensis TaxID=45068 RepID=A0A0W0VJK9_9GAMM|nr:endopeptidase IV [Legionella londiniensis]KTD20305.1 enhanced entry protein EnhB [Legionella londiniensis]STX93907.1 enhanced entry protein EnhB [Legionella londiniensis]